MSFLGGLFNPEALTGLQRAFVKLSRRIPSDSEINAETAHSHLINASQLAMQVNALKGCDDTPVMLNGVDLYDLKHAAILAPGLYLKGLHYSETGNSSYMNDDLSFGVGSELNGCFLDDINLKILFLDLDLSGASAKRLKGRVILNDCIAENVDFEGSDFAEGSSLENTSAYNANFLGCNLERVDFDRCALSEAKVPIESFFKAKNTNWLDNITDESRESSCFFYFKDSLVKDLELFGSGNASVVIIDHSCLPIAENTISVLDIPEAELVEFGVPEATLNNIRQARKAKQTHDSVGEPSGTAPT